MQDHKKDWFQQAENESKELYKSAEAAAEENKDLKVCIVKRLPRFDRSSADLIGIKSEISDFANTILKQEWIKSGRPSRINILDLKLNLSESKHIRHLIYGDRNSSNYDGVTPIGKGVSRHFSYRVKQALEPIVTRKNVTAKISEKKSGSLYSNIGKFREQRNHKSRQARAHKSTIQLTKLENTGIQTYNRFSSLPDHDMGNF